MDFFLQEHLLLLERFNNNENSHIGDGKSPHPTSSRFIGAVFRKLRGGAGAGQDTLRLSV